jgi:hypothetical protein
MRRLARARGDRFVARTPEWLINVLGVAFLGLGVWGSADTSSFTLVLANFGPENAHLVHDFAACSATFGLGLLIAARLPAWRAPVLMLAAIWNGLHAASHVVDAGSAEPAVVGPVEAVLLIGVSGVLFVLARRSMKEQG